MYHLLKFLFALLLPIGLLAQESKVTIQGRMFEGYLDNGRFLLLNSKNDTLLYPSGNYYMRFKFSDFDNDGNKDILLEVNDHTPERYELYLYSPKTRRFQEVKDFYDFAAPEPIKGTKLYYSYNKAGCADATWQSFLFYIKNYKPVKVGYINGEGCGIKDGIYIYRQRDGEKLLIKTFPLNTIEQYKDRKWGFLKSYWTKNYRKFL